jgi:hypothetical protein
MKAYFVDLDCLINVSNQVWVVDKNKPNIPIMKLSKEDFNLFKSGIYISQGNKITFNGQVFWLPKEFYDKLKVKLKNTNSSLGNLAISLQEFMNKDLIDNLEFTLDEWMISKLKNRVDDIYVICSKQTKTNWESIIEKLTANLLEEGIQIKDFYYISETFYNQKDDDIIFKKARLWLQHLVGYKTDGLKFIDEEPIRYDEIIAYDNHRITLDIKKDLNSILKTILGKTPESLSRVIKENIDDYKPKLNLIWLSENKVNREKQDTIHLDYSNLVKSFEKFFYKG